MQSECYAAEELWEAEPVGGGGKVVQWQALLVSSTQPHLLYPITALASDDDTDKAREKEQPVNCLHRQIQPSAPCEAPLTLSSCRPAMLSRFETTACAHSLPVCSPGSSNDCPFLPMSSSLACVQSDPSLPPHLLALILVSVHIIFVCCQTRTAYGVFACWRGTRAHSNRDWSAHYAKEKTKLERTGNAQHVLAVRDVQHVIIVPAYKEDVATLREVSGGVERFTSTAAHSPALLARHWTYWPLISSLQTATMSASEWKSERQERLPRHRG